MVASGRVFASVARVPGNAAPVGRSSLSELAKPIPLLHIGCVRGSPLFRTFCILLVVAASGFLFVRLTATPKVEERDFPDGGAVSAESDAVTAKVRVTFSHPVGFIDLKIGEEPVTLSNEGAEVFTAETFVEPGTVMFLKAACAPVLEGRLFAKLVVEAEGEKTFTHVFDADGEIDDFVELPF